MLNLSPKTLIKIWFPGITPYPHPPPTHSIPRDYKLNSLGEGLALTCISNKFSNDAYVEDQRGVWNLVSEKLLIAVMGDRECRSILEPKHNQTRDNIVLRAIWALSSA